MKPFRTAILASAAILSTAAAQGADFREHRGVYISPYVQDWPSTGIQQYNASSHQRSLTRQLDKLQAGGVNVVYFAVRPLCDAAYESSYEPWSSTVSGERGKAPAFDPLAFLIQEAHARGIEVYTWVNAYRYCTRYKHGESPLDYELSHPEWLLVQEHETILNPALEEVKQRVCDVATEIVTKYDIDGFLFDDYYYTNGMPFELDKAYYDAALAADPSTPDTQLQWRINNVSSLIKRVGETVKGIKPWVVYGIKPAGVASPPNIRDYGLEPSPSDIRETDWQYKGVAADPIYWYSQHYCDFMAPQIYWCDLFDPLQEWWVKASRKFDRHLYSAVSMSKFADFGAAEFAREAEYGRSLQADNINGIGFFRWAFYTNETGKLGDKLLDFPEYMGATAFATKTLNPVRPWNNVYSPAYVTGLRREGYRLVWDAAPGAPRYTIYAFAPGEVPSSSNDALVQVRYDADFTIPAELADHTFGVAVYDRYGNEYSMTVEGAAAARAVVPQLLYPADGAVAADLFDFTWADTGCDNMLQIASEPTFAAPMVMLPTSKSAVSSYVINNLEAGRTYYWRLLTSAPNAPTGYSEVRSFVASTIEITGPSGSQTPTSPVIEWTPAYAGSTYTVEVATDAAFKKMVFTDTVAEARCAVPGTTLYYGSQFYCRVTAERGGRRSVSPVGTFVTVDGVPEVPRFVNPAAGGVTIHSDQSIEVERPEGAATMLVQVSTDPEFKTGVYRSTLRVGETATPPLSRARISGKALVDGQSYNVRVCARYFSQDAPSTEKETDYAVSSFVYSATEGVNDAAADRVSVADGVLSGAQGQAVAVYSLSGALVLRVASAPEELSLRGLAQGLYIVKTPRATIKFVK